MKIYDCFMFSDEKMLLDIRLNSLNRFVDKFIITEASYFHNGQPKKLNFNINEFSEFKKKIEYIVVSEQPSDLYLFNDKDSSVERDRKKIFNSIRRDNFQRDQLMNGLKVLDEEDVIILSDLDEIPNFENIDLKTINNEIVIFKQKMFYYKFNLYYKDFIWFGSKALKKKNFISPQWLRNIKSKNYPFWRLDTYFSKKKYNNIRFVENGGWHFTCIKRPEDIHKKLLTFAHHQDYESSEITLQELKNKINEKRVLYDHVADKKIGNKWFSEKLLQKIESNLLPSYLRKNLDKFKNWFD